MDACFKGTEDYIVVYIDDILVFSETIQDHEKLLREMLKRCKENGLILSPSKMKIGQSRIEFLGTIIDQGRIQLQPNVIKKICRVKTESLENKTGLRSWLGLLNYARPYMPEMGKLLGPLYAKISPTVERRLNQQDRKLVATIMEKIKRLPDLEIPPEDAYIIIETDGCMTGWGGICKWKPKENDPRRLEKPCAYASGTFTPIKSTIDAEIHAAMNSLKKFKLFYTNKRQMTIRTDCQAIISFCNESNQNKPSRVRWINFVDFVTGCGVDVRFEHIERKDNAIADALSRLVGALMLEEEIPNPNSLCLLQKALEEVNTNPKQCSQETLARTLLLLTGDTEDASKTRRNYLRKGHVAAVALRSTRYMTSKQYEPSSILKHTWTLNGPWKSTCQYRSRRQNTSECTVQRITTGATGGPQSRADTKYWQPSQDSS